MSPLQTVSPTLDALYEDVVDAHAKQADAKIKEAFKKLSTSYYNIGKPNRVRPDYTDTATRFAYAYKYVGCHAYVLRRVLEKLPRPAFLSKKALDVTCIGGGPGSDLIGVLDFISRAKPSSALKKVEFSIFDKEPGWLRNLEVTEAKIPFDIEVESAFCEFDATEEPKKSLKLALRAADLVSISFLVSELLELDCSPFWEAVFEAIPSGCLVIICDIGSDGLQEFLAQFSGREDVKVLISGQEEFATPGPTSLLNPHCDRLDHRPKLKSDTTYAVFSKR
ncbi:hypothetical protein [uncultured Brevundimonas sp.]|uniref:hypothetical protein n=1 Tax=uncultured Brevundimonas sp. TaxID=213418 RepID=UPI0025F43BAA|nr:hypothetical protein [uncultured Brevundimonas sp.]